MPSQSTFDTPEALFLHTGKLQKNADLDEASAQNMIGGSANLDGLPDLKYNQYVVYDEAQIRMRYLLQCQVQLLDGGHHNTMI